MKLELSKQTLKSLKLLEGAYWYYETLKVSPIRINFISENADTDVIIDDMEVNIVKVDEIKL